MFVAQLTELLTQYGKIDEVWFDGACGEGPNGKKQVYDWTRYRNVIHSLQPNAVVAIQGDDVRWVGNEAGKGRETEWSATALMPAILEGSTEANDALGLNQLSPDLGSRALLEKANALYWWPSEVDVSIRPGWFYHKNERPKQLSQLSEIYINSIGRNSVLLLNIPPTTDGLIASADSARLMELRNWVDTSFADNLVAKKANKNRQIKLRKGSTVNCVVIGEDITKGQRVEEFELVARKNGVLTRIAKGTTIGVKRILTFPAMQTDEITLNIKSERGTAQIAKFEAYNILLPSDIIDAANANVKFVPTTGWSCLSHADGAKAFDGDAATVCTGSKDFVVDMGGTHTIDGFAYTPEVRADNAGLIFKYEFYVSSNGTDWQQVATPGEFGNIQYNPLQQFVTFDAPVSCRYVKFRPVGSVNGDNTYSIAEFGVTTK
jgi:alpha-L-fucosidase